jgi:CHASE3 domain sensor protein
VICFASGEVNIAEFFAKYAALLADNPAQQQAVTERKAVIRHLDYDWTLNDAKK